jgi:peptide deformylase
MSVREILQLGNPILRTKCAPVKEFGTPRLETIAEDLRDTLYDFKQRNGFGRGIAAAQIGATDRVLFIHIEEPLLVINPVITRRSKKMMSLWDECFSLPNLLVKVRRHTSIEVRYRDIHGKRLRLSATRGLSELLQHEIDHLNGILGLDRAIDSKHIVFKTEFDKWAYDRRR